MQKLAVIVIMLILAFGCVAQKEIQNENASINTSENITANTNQTNNAGNLNCENACQNRERPSCVGNWNINEADGECICQFVCQIPQEETTSVPSNPNVNDNESAQVLDQRNVEQIMNDSVNGIKNDFYSRYSSGIFTQTTYMVIPEQIDPQNSVTFGNYVELLPEVNGEKENRMIGFANVVFKDNSGMIVKIYNSFLFNESTSRLDSSENYRVSYSNKIIRGCINTKKDLIPKTQNRIYSNIIATCDRVIENN